jgi:predicted nucleic acid-binding protein
LSEGGGSRELILDTSVAVKFHVPEERHEEARRLQRGFENGAVSLLAPGTLLPEVFNAFWQKYRRDELTRDEVRARWEVISELPLSLYAPEDLIDRAVEISCQRSRVHSG